MLAFLNHLRTSIKERQKEELAGSFYKDQLMQKVTYAWTKIANQSKIDKNTSVRGFRSDKAYSLSVKAFSSLLFHRNEMKHIRKQKTKYRFFKMNRVFSFWSRYIIKKQEHEIKVNYFRTRWNLIQRSQVLQAWKAEAYKWRMLMVSYQRQVYLKENNDKAGHMLAWRSLFKEQRGHKKALVFKYFKMLKANRKRC